MTHTGFYRSALRPLLFRLPGEVAHAIGATTLGTGLPWCWLGRSLRVEDPRLHVSLGGLRLDNPVGLSAGFDKNAQALPGLRHLGFGYLTVGSILPERRAGNARPRLIRYPEKESLLNCYGLPSDGRDVCVARLRSLAAGSAGSNRTPVVANIDAPSLEQYLVSFGDVEPHVDAVELGLQCPNNTEDHGGMHEPRNFERLLQEVTRRRTKPVFVKMGFYMTESERQNRFELVEIAIRYGIDAVVIPGIWKQEEPRVSLGIGATSGRITFERNLRTVRELAGIARGRIAIKSNGGVFSGEDAFQVMMAGATSIDLLTAFVYRGWSVAADINRELLALLDEHRIRDIRHVRELAAA